jgi:Gas vesicle synthesis protein GvpL/GvpF
MMRAKRGPALRFFGLVAAQATDGLVLRPGIEVEVFRDLAAVVTGLPGWRRTPDPPDLGEHREIVAQVFARCAIVPAPPGIVFRSADALQQWLEVHYAALQDAVAHVDGRAEARVHVRRSPTSRAHVGRTAAIDVHAPAAPDTVAVGIFQELARDARAWILSSAATAGGVPKVRRVPAAAGAVDAQVAAASKSHGVERDDPDASASFLVDRSRWRAFADAVATEGERNPAVDVELTGPWPPYDFVRLQFGG